jgi:hypothetical protein
LAAPPKKPTAATTSKLTVLVGYRKPAVVTAAGWNSAAAATTTHGVTNTAPRTVTPLFGSGSVNPSLRATTTVNSHTKVDLSADNFPSLAAARYTAANLRKRTILALRQGSISPPTISPL